VVEPTTYRKRTQQPGGGSGLVPVDTVGVRHDEEILGNI
jgi:hypothetical protein